MCRITLHADKDMLLKINFKLSYEELGLASTKVDCDSSRKDTTEVYIRKAPLIVASAAYMPVHIIVAFPSSHVPLEGSVREPQCSYPAPAVFDVRAA